MLPRLNASIGSRLFLAFVTMGLITGALGGYSAYLLSTAQFFVTDTYDRTLMSVSYARAAALDFTRMDKELLRRRVLPASEHAAIDDKLAHLATSFTGDLDVVGERSVSDKEKAVIGQIRKLDADWNAMRSGGNDDDLEAADERMIERLDMLVELTADNSFVSRRKSIDAMVRFTWLTGAATLGALLLSAGITLALARRIVRPLRDAAAVANRISAGELGTSIPAGGTDEAGILLRSLTVMQDSIRVMVEREKARRRSAQNRLVEALENTSEGIVLVDADGRIVLANSQLSRFFPSLGPAIAPGMALASVFARIGELVIESDADGPLSATGLLSEGSQFRLRDGRWVRVSRSPTRDGGFILLISDFSEIKERELGLNEARQLAESANAAKTAFLANISHELRTPLNAIIGFSEILVGQMFGPLGNDKYHSYANDIVESGRHLLTVINNVLDLTKSQSGQLRLVFEPLDLCEIVASCATIMRDLCARAELNLHIKAPREELVMSGDAAKLRQVLLNLMSNAVKFTEPGGEVSVTLERTGFTQVQIQVRDTGIGMSAEDIPIALAAFGQVDSRLSRRYEGTGLGLPLTKVLVELHGGSISLESRVGVGTVVTVALPLEQETEDALELEAHSAAD
ncbi:MAG TPA: ATP-binding protein [Stellaceae bacterium]|jgi:signal transduction histidine kinase